MCTQRTAESPLSTPAQLHRSIAASCCFNDRYACLSLGVWCPKRQCTRGSSGVRLPARPPFPSIQIHATRSLKQETAYPVGSRRSLPRLSGRVNCIHESVLFMRSYFLWLLAALGLTAAPVDSVFFEKKIRPVLAERCWSCHSTKAKISFADLQLDSSTGAAKVVVAGKPEESPLYRALSYGAQTKMPPSGKLPAAVIDDFKTWIANGARWPEEAPATVAQKSSPAGPARAPALVHWAWKPVVRPAATSIDSLLLAKLTERGLRPLGDAPPATWLRRVTFDLTGLPPTVEEQEAFERDPSREKVVDRLLASSAFGERWGRHWLDQTYYADTIEIGRRVPARHAWRYRDYVVDSFNRDVPYPRFILEQLAGDQLEWTTAAERRNNLTATGFLPLGPWPLVNADKEQLKMDVVDLQVDMVGRTFLGLTMGCSRCHDHKFDPITLKDYYGMAGIFSSTRTLSGRLGLSVFSNINAVSLPETPEEMTRRAAETKVYWEKLTAARAELAALRDQRKPLEKDSPEAKSLDKKVAAAVQEVKLLEYLPVVPPTAHAVQDADTPADGRINIRGNAHQLGAETPRSGVAIAGQGYQLDVPDFTSGRQQLAEWIGSKSNPLTARVAVNRIWHHLFGVGIVPTIDNFGTRGAAPSHPELLDYLAAEFVDQGWSVKKLVRTIVLSQAYGRSSANDTALLEADPENRLLWRMNRRRLEAETLRDAMLAVSGTLDRRAGGEALPFYAKGNMNLAQPEFFGDDTKLEPSERMRRTVYQPVLRKSQAPELDILNLFNFPDANQITGARQSTTIPTQALYLMNAPFVQEMAAALAERLLAGEASDAERVRTLLRRVYARLPKPGEVERLLEYTRGYSADARTEAWKRLCHSLLMSNEFLYRS